ncbi:MAG: ABC transporter ATP-binding protein [Pseudomonadota bacterium]
MSSGQLLWPGLRPGYRMRSLELIMLAVLQSALVLGLAFGVRLIMRNDLALPVWMLLTMVAGWLLTAAALRLRERYASEAFAVTYVHDLRLCMYDTLGNTAAAQVGSKAVNTVRFASDLTAIRQWAAFSMGRLVSGILLTLAIITGLWILSPVFAVLTLAALTVTALVAWIIGYRLQRTIRHQRRQRGRLTHRIGIVLDTLSFIQRSGRIPRERLQLQQTSEALNAAQIQRGFWSGALRACGDFGARTGLLAILLFTITNPPINGTLPLAALLLASLLQAPLRDLTRVFEYWQSAVVAADKIGSLLQTHATSSGDPQPVTHNEGGTGLRFYAGRTRDGLKLPATVLNPGTNVALVSTAGQHSNNLLRLLTDSTGSELIAFEGVVLDQLPGTERASYVGSALLNDPLMPGTLSKNLRYRARQAKPNQLLKASKTTGLLELVNTLPAGFATRHPELQQCLDPRARQLLNWTRAILGTPPVVVLEQPDRYFNDADHQRFDGFLQNYPGIVIFSPVTDRSLAAAHKVWRIEGTQLIPHPPGQEAA